MYRLDRYKPGSIFQRFRINCFQLEELCRVVDKGEEDDDNDVSEAVMFASLQIPIFTSIVDRSMFRIPTNGQVLQ